MRGGWVFVVFFVMFTFATLVVPAPLFPGSLVPSWFTLPSAEMDTVVSAFFNGLTYGLVVWLVFFVATRNLDESGVSDYKPRKNTGQRNSRRRARA